MRTTHHRGHKLSLARAWSLSLLLTVPLLTVPLYGEPCDEPAPVDDHFEVNLGTAVALPILPNTGRLEGAAPFVAIGFTGHGLAFHDGGAVDLTLRGESSEGGTTSVRSEYLGGEVNARFSPIEAMASTTTILSGGEEAEKRTVLSNYGALESHDVYPGISIRHSTNSRQLRTTYQVAAGVDPGSLRLRFTGVSSFEAHPVTGVLSLTTDQAAAPTLTLEARLSDSGRVTAVPVRVDSNGIVSFEVAPSASSLTLESVLTFGPYFHAPAATSGPQGVVAIGRATGGSSGADAVVLGLDATGRNLRWTTILRGDGDDQATAVTASPTGRIYLTGTTTSSDFPLSPRVGGAGSIFVAELAADGSSLIGGTYLDDRGATAPHNLVVDADGSVLVTGRAAEITSARGLDFITLVPEAETGKVASPYFLARLDSDLTEVTEVATFEAADLGPPLELAVDCGEVVVGYCELPPEAVPCAHPFFEDPYSVSVFGVFEDGFVNAGTERWGYHALRWKAEFKAATYTPMVVPDIPTGLVENGDQWDLINAEANTALFPVNPGGTGPEWARMNADTATALATGAAMNMDLFQTPSYTNLRIDGSDVPAAITELEFCVDGAAGNSLRDLCDITVADLGLGWFQVDIVDSACALQFAGDYFVNQVWVSDWAGGTYTEGRLFDGIAEWEDAYAVMDPGTDIEIYIVDPPEEAPGAPAFTEELAARLESHMYQRLPVTRTVYVDGKAISAEPALAKVRVSDMD